MDFGKQNNLNVTSVKKEERTEAVNAILIDENGRVLLGLRAKHKSGGGQWGLVGGTQGIGETMEETLARELEEEIGITVNPKDCVWNNFFQCVVSDKVHFDHHGFVVTKWHGTIKNMEPNKCDELKWFAPNEIPWDNFFVSKGNLKNYFEKTAYNLNNNFDYRVATMVKNK